MMPTATLQEFQRRLKAAGYDADIDELGAGPVRDGEQYAYVMDDGSIRFKPENRELASRVCGIYGEVSEYMAAFLAAAPGAARFPQGAEDTRTLIAYGGYELAARRLSNDSMDFVTWRLDRNGERETGHYFDGYAEAKEDFALRAGLIDRDKLFDETELAVIRSYLSDYLAIDGGEHISCDGEQAIKDVIGKIDGVIAPAIEREAEAAEDQGFEPEMDL